MKITIIVEGKTEIAFKKHLVRYLERHLAGKMPKLDFAPQKGRVPKGEKLKRVVQGCFAGRTPADHVIALTDVYTGTNPPDFQDAQDAINKMCSWVGDESRFHAHAAQHDFEAWLLPYWADIQTLASHGKSAPPGNPESVNHSNPPSYRIREIFSLGGRYGYVKARLTESIFKKNDLGIAIKECPQLKAFINTILKICGEPFIP